MKRHTDPISECELIAKCSKTLPKNTFNHSNWAMKTFIDWHKSRIEKNITNPDHLEVYKEPSEMTKSELDYLLKFFVHEVRKQNGDRYPGESLKQLIAGIQFYFRNTLNKNISIFTDEEFLNTRKSLDSAMKDACQENVGFHKKQATAITLEMEESLWEKNILGSENPAQLNRTLIYLLGIHLGLRGGQELRNLSVGIDGNLRLERDDNCQEYIMFRESFSKTYKGGLKDSHVNPRQLKVYPNTDYTNRCVVNLFKRYNSLRPKNCKCNAMFLSPLLKPTPTQWYADSPIGKNTLSSSVKHMMEMANIDANFSNHSCRKTTVTRIISATKDVSLAKAATGHRGNISVHDYDQSSRNKDNLITQIIQGRDPGSSNIISPSTSYAANNSETAANVSNASNNNPISIKIKVGDKEIEINV